MKVKTTNSNPATSILTPRAQKVNPQFAALIREWEQDPRGEKLLDLSVIIACSVLKKLADPQRSTAPARDSVSSSGCNPRIVALRRDLMSDLDNLRNIHAAAADMISCYDWSDPVHPVPLLDAKGNPDPQINDDCNGRVNALIDYTISDAMDVVHEAACALLDAYNAARGRFHAAPPSDWLEMAYEMHKPRKTVLLPGDEVQYVPVTVTPVQMVYRAVRRYIQDQGGLHIAVNGYSYVQLDTTDTETVESMDTQLYRRYFKYADIGGYVRGHGSTLPGGPAGMSDAMAGLYTVSGANDNDDLLAAAIKAMRLTARQADILTRLYYGQDARAIASALNVRPSSVFDVMHTLQDRAAALGIAPAGWSAETRKDAAPAALEVVQYTPAGAVVAIYASANSAAAHTGINAGNIRAAAHGKRATAGGFVWRIKQSD